MFRNRKLRQRMAEMDDRLRVACLDIEELLKFKWQTLNKPMFKIGDSIEGEKIVEMWVDKDREGKYSWYYWCGKKWGFGARDYMSEQEAALAILRGKKKK